MPNPKKILDDAAHASGSVFSVLSGIKEEISSIVKGRVDEVLSTLQLVRRDEFEIVTEIASRTRAAQEKLEEQIKQLEARVTELENKGNS